MERKLFIKLQSNETDLTKFTRHLLCLEESIGKLSAGAINDLLKVFENGKCHPYSSQVINMLIKSSLNHTNVKTCLMEKVETTALHPESLIPYSILDFVAKDFTQIHNFDYIVNSELFITYLVEGCSVELISTIINTVDDSEFVEMCGLIQMNSSEILVDMLCTRLRRVSFEHLPLAQELKAVELYYTFSETGSYKLDNSLQLLDLAVKYIQDQSATNREVLLKTLLLNICEVTLQEDTFESLQNIVFKYCIWSPFTRDGLKEICKSKLSVYDESIFNANLLNFDNLREYAIYSKILMHKDSIEALEMFDAFLLPKCLLEGSFEEYLIKELIANSTISLEVLERAILKNPDNIMLIQEEAITKLESLCNIEDYVRIVQLMIYNTSHINAKLTEYLILKLMETDNKLLCIELYCNFSLERLNYKYFAKLKVLFTSELLKSNPVRMLALLNILKKLTTSTKTDYSEYSLELIEEILEEVNIECESMDKDEYTLATMCISIISDMIESGVLNHELVMEILNKKYSVLLNSLNRWEKGPLLHEYCRLLSLSLDELREMIDEDLDPDETNEFDQRAFEFAKFKLNSEEEHMLDICEYINVNIYDKIINKLEEMPDCVHGLADIIGVCLEYMLTHGNEVEVLRSIKERPRNEEEYMLMVRKETEIANNDLMQFIFNKVYLPTEDVGLLQKMFEYELNLKAENREIKNIDFSKLEDYTDQAQENAEKQIIEIATTQLNTRKGYINWYFIPKVFLVAFTTPLTDTIQNIISAVTKINAEDVIKLEGYLENLIEYVSVDSKNLEILPSICTLNNSVMEEVLNSILTGQCQNIDLKVYSVILVDIVRYYAEQKDSHEFIKIILEEMLESADLPIFIETLREIVGLVLVKSINFDAFKTLQTLAAEIRINSIIQENKHYSSLELYIFSEDILALLEIQPQQQHCRNVFKMIYKEEYYEVKGNTNTIIQECLKAEDLQTIIINALALNYYLKDASNSIFYSYCINDKLTQKFKRICLAIRKNEKLEFDELPNIIHEWAEAEELLLS